MAYPRKKEAKKENLSFFHEKLSYQSFSILILLADKYIYRLISFLQILTFLSTFLRDIFLIISTCFICILSVKRLSELCFVQCINREKGIILNRNWSISFVTNVRIYASIGKKLSQNACKSNVLFNVYI